ncbi:MAG: 1-deoxy-D-xylulose-5-phosphate reductoisomerase [Clostridiaceae bacterium]|nr:1-deoxy-D-xylulose-5-phosphate reductoisomerase [Clostridiaceae bacterium]MDY5888623.1 1-deoxy-D-xylulose-5-phosphate reductoisomerase [Oscillospiraceae bacterium]
MSKTVTVLGSTGSIGTQALEVIEMQGYEVKALTASVRVDEIEKQIRKFKPDYAAMVDEKAAQELKIRVADTDTKVLSGLQGVCECASLGADYVLNSIVGMAGLEPTLSAIDAGSEIALANKETLVAGGQLVMKRAKEKGVNILPVDSEHSAIFQSMQGCRDKNEIKKLILTASGGPFFGKKRDELANVTVKEALNHPNWSMGAKITIDSATMMNKGLELIEAVWLFSMDPKDIEIVVHRQSVVHSLVEYCDNSVIAQLGVPDMRIPIQYALTYPNRIPSPVSELSLTDYGTLTFDKLDYETFGLINICRKAINDGGLYPACANAANEEANLAFRQGRINFLQIEELVAQAVADAPKVEDYKLDDVLEMYDRARGYVKEKIKG